MKEKLSRRRFLRGLGTLAAGSALAACAPQTVIVKETVEVEKEVVVTKEVEKVIKETVMVEGTPKVVEKVVKETVVVEVGAPTAEELLQNLPDKLGSPDNARGWKTVLPELPTGYPLAETAVINCSRRLDQQTAFCEGDDFDNNPWSRMIKELFNVEYRTAWTWSTGDEANQKYNLAMASGDLPDFLETVPLSIFVQMVEADLLEDITDAYDAYASPRWKAIWREYGELPWTWSKIDGRIYGLPRVEDLAHNDCILWYREDWLEKVGMSVPTTFDELHDVALAFKEGNLGMGAEGTTVGLLASESYSNTWYGSLDAIWGGYGYIPFHWQPEGDDLMYGAIRPEVKEALGLLNQWYNEGIFRKDFYTITTSQAMSDVGGVSCGLHFTPSWGANRDTVVNDPECVWKFADIPTGPKGFKRRHTENNFRESPFAFRKGFEHVDKVFAVTDWWEQLWHQTWRRMHGWEGCNYTWEGDKVVPTGTSFQNWTPGPVGTRGSGFLDPKTPGTNIRYQLDEWGKIPPAERDAQQELFFDDPTGVSITNAMSRIFILETANEGVMTQFQSLPTATMVERGVDLNKLRDESLIGFITGEKPLSEFDAYVEQWLNLGGAQMTNEVNEWWHNR
jgi:putative aldouronate transport system substrate-binding protein